MLQVGALAVALRRGDGASLVIAGALAGLAIASKLTGRLGISCRHDLAC